MLFLDNIIVIKLIYCCLLATYFFISFLFGIFVV